MKKMNKKGFTLIEMLVVIAIIAVLVAIIIPIVGKSTVKAAAASDAANLRNLASQVSIDYFEDDKVDNTYTATPKSKDLKSGSTLEIWVENNEIKAYFVNGGKYYDVDALSKVAEDGSDLTAAKTPSEVANKVFKIM